MKFKALFLALVLTLSSMKFAYSEEFQPKVAVAYDIGFLGDNSFNDAVNSALNLAKKKYGLFEPFVREVPTNGTAIDRLTRLRFLAKSGYTLIIVVGAGYRDAVRRVSMEYTETQFAIINDKNLGQLNISNIYFREDQGAFLAGVVAALNSKRKAVGFIGSEPDLFSSFQKGVRTINSKVSVVNISYPDEISNLKSGLDRIDVAYSTWDGDAMVLTTVLEKYATRVNLIMESPDQYFATLPGAERVILASVNKVLTKPIDELVKAAFVDQPLIDVIDEKSGIYGREYNLSNGGIDLKLNKKMSDSIRKRISQERLKISRLKN